MKEDPQGGVSVALCGQKLISEASFWLAVAADPGLIFRSRWNVRVFTDAAPAYVILEDFIAGAPGSDAIDCLRCRKKMTAAISEVFSFLGD